ncbi:MAG: LysM peptidoglycan-binding domain-containing protein [Chloroflexi bacterium]|nr:LysM peptidoglycan-binding domain-containing protein [Chloroflexota bacterium]
MNPQAALQRLCVMGLALVSAASSNAANPLIRYPSASSPSASRDSGNLLVNPGFEAPYVKQCCHTEQGLAGLPIDEVQVANGWRGWWYPPGIDSAHPEYCGDNAPPKCQAWHRPEWREAAPFTERIHEGKNAQKYFTFFSVHEAGMVQQVTGVPSGARLRFSIYMHAWSTNDNSGASSGQDDMGLKVGIDPIGDANPWSQNIVWSPVHDAYDTYQLYNVEAVAQGNTVTVFTHSQPMWGLQHNDVYIDDASLIVVGDAPPAPAATASAPVLPTEPLPTAGGPTPVAWSQAPIPPGAKTYPVKPGDSLWTISARSGVAVDTLRRLNNVVGNKIYVGQILILDSGPPTPTALAATPVALDSPPDAATPPPVVMGEVGNICVTVYADTNVSGARDGGEALFAGLAFNLMQVADGAGRAVGGYRTDGVSEPFCFRDLPPANYQIVFAPPTGYAATTPDNPGVGIVPGAVVNVEIGLAPLEAVEAARARARTFKIIGAVLAALLLAPGLWLVAPRISHLANRRTSKQ